MKVYYESGIDEIELYQLIEDFICPDAKNEDHDCKLDLITWQDVKEEDVD